jgi:hypothetical protein
MVQAVVQPADLGSEFDIGVLQTSKIRLNLGIGLLKNSTTGAIEATGAGSGLLAYREISGAQTLLLTDQIVVNTGPASVWILPTLAAGQAGKTITIINHGTGAIALSPVIRLAAATTASSVAFASGINAAGSNAWTVVWSGTQWRRTGV